MKAKDLQQMTLTENIKHQNRSVSLTSRGRNSRGNLAEFAPAFTLFILAGIVPLVCSLIIPIRFCIAQGLIDQTTQRLSRCEKMSQACKNFENDDDWERFLSLCGLKTNEKHLSIIVVGSDDGLVEIEQPASIDKKLLPAAGIRSNTYVLRLKAKLEMKPVFASCLLPIPGVTTPLKFALLSDRMWENTSCDPETRQYYLNE